MTGPALRTAGYDESAEGQAVGVPAIRPSMRFEPINSPTQQSVLMLHQARDLLMREHAL